MKRVTRDDITKAVSGADEVSIAQIIGTGATVDELAEALAWMANDEPMMNAGRPLATGRLLLVLFVPLIAAAMQGAGAGVLSVAWIDDLPQSANAAVPTTPSRLEPESVSRIVIDAKDAPRCVPERIAVRDNDGARHGGDIFPHISNE